MLCACNAAFRRGIRPVRYELVIICIGRGYEWIVGWQDDESQPLTGLLGEDRQFIAEPLLSSVHVFHIPLDGSRLHNDI